MAQYFLNDSRFGKIIISFRSGMHSITARWKNEQLHINAPLGISSAAITDFIDKQRDTLVSLKPVSFSYYLNQRIYTFRHSICINAHGGRLNQIGFGGSGADLHINISPLTDFNSPQVTKAISSCLSHLMAERAESTLIPFAMEVASQLNIMPHHFEIGRGLRKLGHCTTSRVIQLSYNLMFLPEDLVRFVICHELAHLSEMNHSPRFHALCNTYCLGREKSLNKALKCFVWPILR